MPEFLSYSESRPAAGRRLYTRRKIHVNSGLTGRLFARPRAERINIAPGEPCFRVQVWVRRFGHESALNGETGCCQRSSRTSARGPGRRLPLGEIHERPAPRHIVFDAPGDRRHAGIPGPACLGRVAVVTCPPQNVPHARRHRQCRFYRSFTLHWRVSGGDHGTGPAVPGTRRGGRSLRVC